MIKLHFRNQSGESIITYPILMLFVMIILFIGVDLMGVYVANQKLRIVVSETLTLMKMDNEWNDQTQAFFNEMVDKSGFPLEVTQEHTPASGYVQRGEVVTLKANTVYVMKALKPFDKEISFNIEVELSGLAQKYIRE